MTEWGEVIASLAVAVLLFALLIKEVARTNGLGGWIPFLFVAFTTAVGFCWWAIFPILGKQRLPLWLMVAMGAAVGAVLGATWYFSRSERRRSRRG